MRFCNYKLDFSDPESNLFFHYLSPRYNDLHSHNYFECFLITQGEVIHRINGQDFLLKKGSINVIRPNDIHDFRPVGNGSQNPVLINVMITPQKLKQVTETVNPNIYDALLRHKTHFSLQLSKEEFDMLYELFNKYLLTTEGSRQTSVIVLYIYQVIKIFYLKYGTLSVGKTSVSQNNYPDWLQKLIDKFSNPDNFELPLEELLTDVNYSRVHINRMFKQYMHMPMAHYYNKIKLDYAANLLSSTDLLVLEISSKIGYSSLSYFQNLFKSIYGLTPKQYRINFNKIPNQKP